MATTHSLEYTAKTMVIAVELYNEYPGRQSSSQCKNEAEVLDLALLASTDMVEPLERLVMAVGYGDWEEENPFTLEVREAWLLACVVLNENCGLDDEEHLLSDDEEEDWIDDGEDEDQDDYRDDEYDDENAAVRLLTRYIFTPEFEEAIKEHPGWTKFLI